jgi:hypothetical protein
VDEKPYLLPDPPLYKALPQANRGNKASESISSDHMRYTHFGSILSEAKPPECNATIFTSNRKLVYLGQDLHITPRLRQTLNMVIERAGGTLVDSVENAQVYIGAWRAGEDYVQVKFWMCRLMKRQVATE